MSNWLIHSYLGICPLVLCYSLGRLFTLAEVFPELKRDKSTFIWSLVGIVLGSLLWPLTPFIDIAEYYVDKRSRNF